MKPENFKLMSFTADNRPKVIDSSKTQTRRVITGRFAERIANLCKVTDNKKDFLKRVVELKGNSPYPPNSIIGIAEPTQIFQRFTGNGEVYGKYSDDQESFGITLTKREWKLFCECKHPHRKTSARFMYKSLCRHFKRIKRVWVEQVQDISEADCIAEGCVALKTIDTYKNDGSVTRAKWAFEKLWNSINEKRDHGWDKNPWVFCYELEGLKDE